MLKYLCFMLRAIQSFSYVAYGSMTTGLIKIYSAASGDETVAIPFHRGDDAAGKVPARVAWPYLGDRQLFV